ncbi:MAG: hypothetical protein M3Y81_04510 [Chloroflexota bacterium]|nr:hypothetical protein [Chloroflexota bacterium]
MSLFTRLFAAPKPPHDLIYANPRLAMMHFVQAGFLLMTALFFVLFFILIIFFIINEIVTSEPGPFPWSLLFLILIFLFNTGFMSLQIHYWNRIEPWHFAATLGDKRLLADEQPQSNAEGLPIPVTIRVNQVIECRVFLGYLLVFVFSMTLYINLSLMLLLHISFFWSLLIAVLVGGLFTLGGVLIIRIRWPIEVSQEGLQFRTPNSATYIFMFWHEARLFACYPEPGPWNDSPAMIYELSSASQVVYWTWMRRKNPLDFITRPALPFEEHSAQMRALSELIVAKTGLPLYDLSKGRTLKLVDGPRNQQRA